MAQAGWKEAKGLMANKADGSVGEKQPQRLLCLAAKAGWCWLIDEVFNCGLLTPAGAAEAAAASAASDPTEWAFSVGRFTAMRCLETHGLVQGETVLELGGKVDKA